jgi:hypothetical protein
MFFCVYLEFVILDLIHALFPSPLAIENDAGGAEGPFLAILAP